MHKKEDHVELDMFGFTQSDVVNYKPINYTLNKLGCLNYHQCAAFKELKFPRHK